MTDTRGSVVADTTPALERQSFASRIGAVGLYAAGAVAALASAYRANAGSSILPVTWLLWIAAPYLALGLAGDAIGRRPGSRPCHRALLAASGAALAFTAYVYQRIWWGPHYSTEGLVFIFAPVWIVVVTLVVFALAWWLWHSTTHGTGGEGRPDSTGVR